MNYYYPHVNNFFCRITELKHSAHQLDYVLKFSNKEFEEKHKIKPRFATTLIISDWTGPNDHGWEINNYSGISTATNLETERIISQECGYLFAQSFEALEKLFKDLVFEKLKNNLAFFDKVKTSSETMKFLNSKTQASINREKLKGGDLLFDVIKLSCSPKFDEYSLINSHKYNFEKLWDLFSQIRHSITHSNNTISKSKIYKKSEFAERKLINDFLKVKEIGKGKIEITFDYLALSKIQKKISEYGYQVFKMMSVLENLDYGIENL